jgi:hypothetical protein
VDFGVVRARSVHKSNYEHNPDGATISRFADSGHVAPEAAVAAELRRNAEK